MEKADGSKNGTREPFKNMHAEVPESFHRRVKMLCVLRNSTMKDYVLAALEEKVTRDEEEMRKERKG